MAGSAGRHPPHSPISDRCVTHPMDSALHQTGRLHHHRGTGRAGPSRGRGMMVLHHHHSEKHLHELVLNFTNQDSELWLLPLEIEESFNSNKMGFKACNLSFAQDGRYFYRLSPKNIKLFEPEHAELKMALTLLYCKSPLNCSDHRQ